MKYLFLIIALVGGCILGEDRPARGKYNDGLAALAAGKLDDAEKLLIEARSDAGVDPELRYRAAFALGVAYAQEAEKAKSPQTQSLAPTVGLGSGSAATPAPKPSEGPDLDKAIDLEQQAISWFTDASHLKGDKNPDATANLATARARKQAMIDERDKGQNKLEARLDKLIGQQSGVLEAARGAWKQMVALGGKDPLAQQGKLVDLANTERNVVAEAGTIGDLAADEIEATGKKAQDKRTPEEQQRMVQLKNLDQYIGEARSRIAETRRELQDLSAETALAKAEAALVALKRAREQLDDPITVLQHALNDEVGLDAETHQAQIAEPSAGGILSAGGGGKVDKWLEYTALANRQTGIADRVGEVRDGLQAAADVKPEPSPNDKGTPPDPKREKLMVKVRAALPNVTLAIAAMTRAHDGLLDKQWKPARAAEGDAELALLAAIEQFADLKKTVELAWSRHQELEALVAKPAPVSEDLPADELAKRVHDNLTSNLARVDRIAGLIGEAAAEIKDPAPPDPAKADPKDKDGAQAKAQFEAQKQQVEQQRAMYAKAEELRAKAKTDLLALETALAKNGDAVAAAETADQTLLELRKLFFDVVEHLKELGREQAETLDRTDKAKAADDFSRDGMLPGITDRQKGHRDMAGAIHDALAHQADELAKQAQAPAPTTGPTVAKAPGQSPAEQAKKLSDAAAEVRLAGNDMSDALGVLDKAKQGSVLIDPVVTSQHGALDHIQKALAILQPPPPPKNQDQDPKKQDQDQQKQDPKEKDKDKDKDKQDQKDKDKQGVGQRARDEDAKRQKAKKDHAETSDAVDQDW